MFPFDKLWEKVFKEWAVIQQTPITFFIATSLESAVLFVLFRFLYKERMDLLKERIDGLNQSVGLYKDRYGTLAGSAVASPLALLRNSKLRESASKTVQLMREIALEGDSHFETNLPWEELQKRVLESGIRFNSRYESECRSQALLLKKEIESRLASSGIERPKLDNLYSEPTYEHPTNPIGLRSVASDLERLAQSLP